MNSTPTKEGTRSDDREGGLHKPVKRGRRRLLAQQKKIRGKHIFVFRRRVDVGRRGPRAPLLNEEREREGGLVSPAIRCAARSIRKKKRDRVETDREDEGKPLHGSGKRRGEERRGKENVRLLSCRHEKRSDENLSDAEK